MEIENKTEEIPFKEMPKRVRRRYNRFIKKNKSKHDMYVYIYGEAVVGYSSWSFKNILSWLVFFNRKPGFRFLNPDEVYVEEVKNKFNNEKSQNGKIKDNNEQ